MILWSTPRALWNPNRDKHIVHVDVSPAEVDAHYIVDVGVLGDIALSLDQIGEHLASFDLAWAEESRRRVADRIRKGVGATTRMAPATSADHSRSATGAGTGRSGHLRRGGA